MGNQENDKTKTKRQKREKQPMKKHNVNYMFWKLHRYLEKYHIFLKNLYPEESILNFIGVGSIFLDEDDNDDNGDDANDFEDSTNAEDAHD